MGCEFGINAELKRREKHEKNVEKLEQITRRDRSSSATSEPDLITATNVSPKNKLNSEHFPRSIQNIPDESYYFRQNVQRPYWK